MFTYFKGNKEVPQPLVYLHMDDGEHFCQNEYFAFVLFCVSDT